MATTNFALDDIVAELNEEQFHKLADLWARLDVLTDGRISDFSPATLSGLGTQTVKSASGANVQVDMSIMGKKPAQKVLEKTNPVALLDALRRNVKHEDPDTLLVRFLRARSWKPDESLVMLLKSLAWRIEQNIEDGMLAGGDTRYAHIAKTSTGPEAQIGKEVVALLSSGESAVHGRDRKGRLLQYIRVKKHNPKAQGKDGFEKATILDAESTRMLLRAPITTISIVFDLTGFGMGNMDMNALKIMAGGLQDNYPECLGTVYVYNAPWIINGIWSMIKAWLDPVVASKVQFVSSLKALSEFIDPAEIPTYMGGESNWEFKWIEPETLQPLDAESAAKRDSLKATREQLLTSHIDTTRVWTEEVLTNQPSATATLAKRRELAQQLRENYWQLDPYVRGRVMLDRAGILLPGGKVNMRPNA
ncbi:hypothetical protein AMS68_007343 [Peltaster fructicola]|uniref:CRAL-TRIO domain-containing protein n=1 Tax=Peltaster fructicola TaxID=286661 RepID=A0A6H0Y4D9_9PEZI|nr:hypothetical protein AMS68_007343 [Peltaster fructicola]